ncbi:MAG: DMT family transporter, partial [Pseudomonadota bacterium]|nr:DMT family transporter [Pseudomonadota bacterium]
FLQTYAQGMTTPSHAAVIMIVEPAWTATFAALWFGETMSLSQLFGCSLIFLSLVVNRWSAVRMWRAREADLEAPISSKRGSVRAAATNKTAMTPKIGK